MTLTVGYAATSTGAYTVTGTAPVTISKTRGNPAITWNSDTLKLDIAAGLAAGTYPVVLTASNGVSPDATLTFTLTVQAGGNGGGGSDSGGSGYIPSYPSVTPSPTPSEAPSGWQNPFADVHSGDWFYNDVGYVYTNGLMFGTSTDPALFSPNMNLTRGMLVTILYRAAGSPGAGNGAGGTTFTDVPGGMYYTDAVAWATANGIIFGYGDGRFGPNDNITRQDLAVILYRYAQYAGIKLPMTKDYAGFTDEADIANYAKAAIEAFFKAGIISGYPDGSVKPNGETTRVEVASMLHRFLEIEK